MKEDGKTGRIEKQVNWLYRENVTLFLVLEISYLFLFFIFSGRQPDTEALQCCMMGRAELQCMSSLFLSNWSLSGTDMRT